MVFSIVLGVLGLGTLCALVFQLTVYALPACVGLSVGFWAYNAGAGLVAGTLAGLIGGVSALAVGQLMFASSRAPLTRGLVAMLFAVPAGYAGYQATLQFSQLGVSSEPWQQAFASVSALAIGSIAIVRLAVPPNKQPR